MLSRSLQTSVCLKENPQVEELHKNPVGCEAFRAVLNVYSVSLALCLLLRAAGVYHSVVIASHLQQNVYPRSCTCFPLKHNPVHLQPKVFHVTGLLFGSTFFLPVTAGQLHFRQRRTPQHLAAASVPHTYSFYSLCSTFLQKNAR